MAITYLLIFILLFHFFLFKKIIFKWSVFGVFFNATFIFSTFGILFFPIFRTYISQIFWTWNLGFITTEVIIETQMIAVSGMLLVLYSYVFGLLLLKGKVVGINHFKFDGEIKENLNKLNFQFVFILITIFLLIYLFLKKKVLVTGISDGLIGRNPTAILNSRRAITTSYFYVIITYNLLPFLSIVSYYLFLKKRTLSRRVLFYTAFSVSVLLLLLLFQKRPLILFFLSFLLSAFVFKKEFKIKKVKKPKSKKRTRRKYIIYGLLLFSLLMLLYYLTTNYKFDNIYQAVKKLSEVSLLRIFGRLTLPSFFYVHYFPNIESHYHISNIGMLTKFLPIDFYPDNKILFNYYSRNKNGGSLAINSIFDFYGAFGYYGLVIGSMILGFLLSTMDVFLNKLEKNGINLIFIIFCFVFAYYLSQASLAKSLMGYGFFFFVMIWIFLQKGFKIKMR